MMHQFRDKKEIIRRRKIIQNVIGFGVLIIFASLGGLAWSGKIFNFIGEPIWKVSKAVNEEVSETNIILRTKKSVFLENENLLNENNRLRTLMIDYEIVKKENDHLKELFGRVPEKNEFVLANILAKPNSSPYDTIIIDVGSNDNIQKGQKVYGNVSIPLGTIEEVYQKTSLVALYSNPNQKTEAMLEGSNASVELNGRGGGNFEMIAPVELEVEKGMTVVLPGIQSEIIAYVEEIISSPSDPVKVVLLSSPLNVQNLKWVEVKK